MMTYRPELRDIPERIRALPIDRGYPVPWFVKWIDGKPEFRVMDGDKFVLALRDKRCWVCGQRMGKFMAFVIGPMCAVNRTSAEPPCHYECAAWSAKFCPFLSRPHMVRREDEEINNSSLGAHHLPRNPGVGGVWVTTRYTSFKAPGSSSSGLLFEMGAPSRVEWYAEGREATRAEVTASIDSGMPTLEAMCNQEKTVTAVLEAKKQLAAARLSVDQLLPA